MTTSQPQAVDPFPPGYGEKVQKITALLDAAPTSQPSSSDSNMLLDEAANDPDFRIRVRAMAVLPFVQEREKAIDVLIAATRIRDPDASGGGNVPLYATTYLADMKAIRAIPAVADWVSYLQRKHPYDARVEVMILKKSTEDLQRLQAPGTRPAS